MKDIIGSKIILCFYIIVTTTEHQESEASPLQNQPAVEVEVAGVNQGVVQTSEMEVEGEDVAGGVKNSVEVTPKDRAGAVTHLPSECVWGILTLREISLSLPEITPTLSEMTPTLPKITLTLSKITQTLPEITLVPDSPRDHLRL